MDRLTKHDTSKPADPAWRVKARDLRLKGYTLQEIAAVVGKHESSVSRAIKDLPKQRIVRDGYVFTAADILDMRRLYLHGMRQKTIAKLYQASIQTVCRFIGGKARVKGNISKGSLKGEANSFARLTAAQVLKARKDHAAGTTPAEIAKRLNITHNYACILVRRKPRTWKHLPSASAVEKPQDDDRQK
jgi:transposase